MLALGILVIGGCTPVTDNNPPNIVYMLADDLGYGELGSYGQSLIRTPNLDRLAEDGMRFTQHYSGSPVCAPSRATLLTGLSTLRSQIRDNYEVGGYPDPEELGQMPLDSGTYTIGTMLQDAGYVTGAIGKWGLGGRESLGQPRFQGFDYFFGYLDQQLAHNFYPTHLWRNGSRVDLDNEYFSAH
ncbi:MAG TPA: N-acetylgalactosamine-6-sulfatase, partial [Gemmatimonadetes bacterium]|nr:N-acetylgalactosamine-6-sulfatase [Gemmatimonadota bacterium]